MMRIENFEILDLKLRRRDFLLEIRAVCCFLREPIKKLLLLSEWKKLRG